MNVRRWLPPGLRSRLVITFTVVALSASVLLAALGYQLVRQALLQRAEQVAVADVRDALERLPLPVGSSDPLWPSITSVTDTDLTTIVELLGGRDREVVVQYDRHIRQSPGSRIGLAGIPKEFREAATSRLVYQRQRVDDQPVLFIGTQVHRKSRAGVHTATGMRVYVIVSLGEEERVLLNLRTALLQAGAVTLAIAIVLALFSARQVLLPVRRLGAAARALGAGRLDTRLPVRGRDELAELTATFNETAAALEQTVSELRTLEAMSRRFVADVSHELRTPLAAMTAVTDMLSEEAERLPAASAQAVRLVLTEIDRLRVLVEHLIEVSRFDSGAAVLHRETVAVADVVTDCLELRGWTERVQVLVPAELTFSLDPRRFDVIVANLVGNALRHGAPPVVVSVREFGEGLRLRVRDHGPGIPPEALPHVFDRFFKAGPDRARSEGSGLGLAIAKANAELHGGTISVEARRPGTLFTVWIPRPENRS